MKPLSVVGADSDSRFVERLVGRLEKKGSVGLVTSTTREPPRDSDVQPLNSVLNVVGSATHHLSDDGMWAAAGTGERTVNDLLDELAPTYEYVIVEGFTDVDIPTVTLGNIEHVGPTLVSAPTAREIDLETLVEEIEEIELYETLETLVAKAKESPASEYAGALATFTGRVRTKEDEGDPPTQHLEFERYDGVAEEKMNTISEELCERDGVYEVLLHHRVGVVEAEEDIVFVIVLAGHRPEAFKAVSDGIDRLKDEVPLFKKEVTVEGEYWRHEVSEE